MIKSISKRILCILLLTMIAICFCACSTVTVSTVTNTDGTIDELVYISLDREEIMQAGSDFDTIKNDVVTLARIEASQIMYQYNHTLNDRLVNAPNQETYEVLMGYMNGVQVVGDSWSNDIYCIGIRFKNIDVYRYHYNISAKVEVKTEVEEHFLYNRVSYQAYTMYANYNDLYTRLLPHFSGEEYSAFELNDTEFIYTYITDSRRQHSNADYVRKVNGEYYHSWIVDNNYEVITFYYNIANKTNWIICALGATCLVGVILGVVIFIINKLKKKKTR